MACEVRWTDSARNDVENAVRYIALVLGSPGAATSLLEAIDTTIDEIAAFPEASAVGTHRVLAERGLRKRLVKRYVLLYSYDGDTVIISRMFHTLQDYARIIGSD